MSGSLRLRRSLAALAALLLWWLAPAAARAQTTFPGAEHIADALTANLRGYKGQFVEPPAPVPRPALAGPAARSTLRPLAVHAGPGVSAEKVDETLAALEAAHDLLGQTGWPAPWPDGGRGGTGGFDLYLAQGGERAADAHADSARIPWMHLDSVSTFAVVDPSLDGDALEACVTSAYAQAVLLGQDPAEAIEWRRATGTWLSWMVTGRFGCDDSVMRQQQQPWRSWIIHGSRGGAGGALLLAMISDRHGRGTGAYVREVWQLARQNTKEGANQLRGSPDVWQALEVSIEAAGSKLKDDIVDFAVARWLTGKRDVGADATFPSLRGLPSDATPPTGYELAWDDLPVHTDEAEPAIEPYGSVYAVVDLSEAPEGERLRTWLRGEYGVEWSMVALRLGADRRPRQRMTAPPREVPHAYLPVELFDDTDEVLVVVTNLSARLPDADIPDENVRSLKLIFDDNEDDHQGGGEGGQ